MKKHSFTPLGAPTLDKSIISTLLIDRNKNLWIGSTNIGLSITGLYLLRVNAVKRNEKYPTWRSQNQTSNRVEKDSSQ